MNNKKIKEIMINEALNYFAETINKTIDYKDRIIEALNKNLYEANEKIEALKKLKLSLEKKVPDPYRLGISAFNSWSEKYPEPMCPFVDEEQQSVTWRYGWNKAEQAFDEGFNAEKNLKIKILDNPYTLLGNKTGLAESWSQGWHSSYFPSIEKEITQKEIESVINDGILACDLCSSIVTHNDKNTVINDHLPKGYSPDRLTGWKLGWQIKIEHLLRNEIRLLREHNYRIKNDNDRTCKQLENNIKYWKEKHEEVLKVLCARDNEKSQG